MNHPDERAVLAPAAGPDGPPSALWALRARWERWGRARRICVRALIVHGFAMAYLLLAHAAPDALATRIVLWSWLAFLLAWFICVTGQGAVQTRIDRLSGTARSRPTSTARGPRLHG